MSTCDSSTLYTTLPHQFIKDKLIDLINRTYIRENTQYLACNDEYAFFTTDVLVYKNDNFWSCKKKSMMPLFILWITFVLDVELNFIGKL